ncbi:MAG: cell wall-binding repeat-containing protein [Lachnospiraceae bacterium]|nr:cell wall-binding repeat-containing protein [Lachnospiraceae bacterium]
MKKLFGRFLAVMLAACTLVSLTPAVRADADDTITIITGAEFVQTGARKQLGMINGFRTGSEAWAWDLTDTVREVYSGLGTLEYDYALELVAMQRALEIAIQWGHSRPDGSSCFTAYDERGYSYYTCGENIAAGYQNDEAAFTALREDGQPYSGQGHRRNMLSSAFNRVGVAHVVVNGVNYYVQEFAKSDSPITYMEPLDEFSIGIVDIRTSWIKEIFVGDSPEPYEIFAGEEVYLPLPARGFSYEDSWPADSVLPDFSPLQWMADDPTMLNIDYENSYVMTGLWSGITTIRANYFDSSFAVQVRVLDVTKERIYGKSRYDTSLEIAKKLQEIRGGGKFDAVVVAGGDTFADALAGSSLAIKKGAPILLVGKTGNGVVNAAEFIRENLAEGGNVYILGGNGVVPELVEESLAGISVSRLSGRNRFVTNMKILEEIGVDDGDELIVVAGENFADALSASSLGLPIMLVSRMGLADDQREFLEDHSFGAIHILGGTAAVTSDTEAQIREAAGETDVNRISGKSRYETSVKVAERFIQTPACVTLATGTNYPDGLAGGPLAHELGVPLLLAGPGGTSAASGYKTEKDVDHFIVFGGTGALSDEVLVDIAR